MAQGKNRKQLNKKVRKGDKGFPVATVCFYGPDNTIATKVVCAIFACENAEPKPMKKLFATADLRKSEIIIAELLAFITEHGAKSVSMIDDVLGCPHQEGIDYPEGEYCPECDYWQGRERII